MPKKPRTFTPAQVARVRKMHHDNCERRDIAAAISLTVKGLEWHMRKGDFGKLPSRQGANTGRKAKDDEKNGGGARRQKTPKQMGAGICRSFRREKSGNEDAESGEKKRGKRGRLALAVRSTLSGLLCGTIFLYCFNN